MGFSVVIFFLSYGSRPMNDSMYHSVSFTFHTTSARYVFCIVRFAILSWSACMARSFLAMMMSQEVSLSRRWTIPGRSTQLMIEGCSSLRIPRVLKWYNSAFTSVHRLPSSPGVGWVLIPASLFTIAKSSFSNMISSGISSATSSICSTFHCISMTSPRYIFLFLVNAAPLHDIFPSSIIFWR